MLKTLLIAVALVSVSTGTSVAGDGGCPNVPRWHSNVNQQMEELLSLRDAHRRGQAMQLVLDLKRRGCFQGTESLNNKLLEIYREDPLDSHRVMAALVLNELGDVRSRERMRELVREIESETVRRVTLGLLSQHTVGR